MTGRVKQRFETVRKTMTRTQSALSQVIVIYATIHPKRPNRYGDDDIAEAF